MVDRFLALLVQATANIPACYFQLPITDLGDPIYRERVYTYELYHQLRSLLTEEHAFDDFSLSGEIDKAGHPIIRKCAPDFVLHVPGNMGGNLVVVEVKAANTERTGIGKDRETLEYFITDEIGYRCGVQLFYGGDERDIPKFLDAYQNADPRILLLWHRMPGRAAIRLN